MLTEIVVDAAAEAAVIERIERAAAAVKADWRALEISSGGKRITVEWYGDELANDGDDPLVIWLEAEACWARSGPEPWEADPKFLGWWLVGIVGGGREDCRPTCRERDAVSRLMDAGLEGLIKEHVLENMEQFSDC